MIHRVRRHLFSSFKIIMALAIIYWLASSDKLNFSAVMVLFQPKYLAISLLLMLISQGIPSERWRLLVRSQNIPLKFWASFQLSYIGYFFNFVMPGGVGGDFIKGYYLHRDFPESKVIAASSILMDRLLGLYAMVIVSVCAMAWDSSHVLSNLVLRQLFIFVVVLFLLFSSGLFVLFSNDINQSQWIHKIISFFPLHEKITKLYQSFFIYGRNKKAIFGVLLYSFISQAISIVFLYLIGNAIGVTDFSLKTYFLVAPLGFMATAIPISPAGIGVGQAAFYFLFNAYSGRESNAGPTIMTIYQVFTLLLSTLGAFFYIRRR